MCNRVDSIDNGLSYNAQSNKEKIREKRNLVPYWMKQECETERA